jgi:hypothetical protein
MLTVLAWLAIGGGLVYLAWDDLYEVYTVRRRARERRRAEQDDQ